MLLLLLSFLQYEIWFANGSVCEIHRIKLQTVKMEEQNKELQEKNAILAADVTDLKKGDEAVEERARMDLGMLKKNEVFYQIIN